ncbi:MAG TPA: UDP-N-acetylmuramoyl-L-alanine--D-glutamate ligase [Chitinophagaceae bacterium]|jgi:UDP-N-acetylmuramoylalanine--D-glutamate ligase|nr:UDP-N-acetylmuramoyl-L-alanine--D-glutamate ligase [Chitinophagaceae bacterium]MBK7736069.1 UDP-N-acetylmuramoyl-L-alanine--D-glutamate ligase [Chitinophagaceae bacterium]MBK8930332.1 UDP-N-acetylmuramoyl-L-alanine--D-glutamate ligase [Chitinophagaceae bacterium]HAO04362.1 UDP-N-acetylmuramoyl-L-alanine--D-glutamate ligase [Chitinophagaceae bacterium]HAZ92739.1 UDP-N-acetylmuramoyl-L-alanine--D-glutamate ligase [Chitinophagaceae bacterium]
MVILGAAESGVGAAILASKQGYEVFVSDSGIIKDTYRMELNKYGIIFEQGGHTEDLILNASEVMKSPGIPEKNSLVKKIRAAGIPVISEIELAYRYKGKSKIIGITGSNGKTTTTSLIYHICKHAGLDCAVVGNIGFSFARQVAEEPKEWYIAEISSFQLDDISSFRPDVAVLTNITEDHLDRYNYKVENYIKSKFRIIENQNENDVFVYCADDELTIKNITNYTIKSIPAPIAMNKELPQGAYLTNAQMHIKWRTEEMQMSINDFALKGKHNYYNSMAASMATTAIDIRKEKIREALQTFETLEHRMEPVATIKGVEFINDSKATNVNSTWYALESMEKPVVLILGGVDKGNDYAILKELVAEKVKAIVCLGTDNLKIHEAFANVVPQIVNTDNAVDAVATAFHFAGKGDVVLLSPACASFDLFKNYEDRGLQFKKAVKNL